MSNLALLVEGEGDVEAVPILVKRLLTEQGGWDAVRLDNKPPLRVGGLSKLISNDFENWRRFLGAAAKRANTSACLLLLDGDANKYKGTEFCAASVARELAEASKPVGGGSIFSVAVVFACREYESWLLAGLQSLEGKRLKDGRSGVRNGAVPPNGDLEIAPRDAKGCLNSAMESGYRQTIDQGALTELLDFDIVRRRPMRSFQRLESSISQLIDAGRRGVAIVSPTAETS